MKNPTRLWTPLLLAALSSVPVAAWALYKPVRVLAPAWVGGITCVADSICLDDPSRFPEASALYREAVLFVGASAGAIQDLPRVVFCSTESCYRSFGFWRSSASTVGTSGTR